MTNKIEPFQKSWKDYKQDNHYHIYKFVEDVIYKLNEIIAIINASASNTHNNIATANVKHRWPPRPKQSRYPINTENKQ